MAHAGRAGGQHCDGSGATGSYQVTVARLVRTQVVATRADESPQRHKASLRGGQALTATTAGIIAAGGDARMGTIRRGGGVAACARPRPPPLRVATEAAGGVRRRGRLLPAGAA